MIGIGMLNLGSLVFGLLALVLPVTILVHHNKTNNKKGLALSVVSISACAISLWMQLFYTNHLVKIEDWSALMDTSNAVVSVSTILLVITITLNFIVLVVYHEKKSKE